MFSFLLTFCMITYFWFYLEIKMKCVIKKEIKEFGTPFVSF